MSQSVLELKRELNQQRQETKLLNTRIQRLTQDLKKEREQKGIPAKETQMELSQQFHLDKLQLKMEAIEKSNTLLKQKLVNQPKQQQMKKPGISSFQLPKQIRVLKEENEQLQLLCNRLREKLEEAESKLSGQDQEQESEVSRLKHLLEMSDLEKLKNQQEIEILQQKLEQLKKLESNQQSNFNQLMEKSIEDLKRENQLLKEANEKYMIQTLNMQDNSSQVGPLKDEILDLKQQLEKVQKEKQEDQQLRSQYIQAMQDLDKYKYLLKVSESLNEEIKMENKNLQQQMQQKLQKQQEKLDEMSQLDSDMQHLEAQIRQLQKELLQKDQQLLEERQAAEQKLKQLETDLKAELDRQVNEIIQSFKQQTAVSYKEIKTNNSINDKKTMKLTLLQMSKSLQELMENKLLKKDEFSMKENAREWHRQNLLIHRRTLDMIEREIIGKI